MEIAILTICQISGHVFHENFTDFDRVFGVSDENGTYYDRESIRFCTESEKNTQPVARVGGKKYLAL